MAEARRLRISIAEWTSATSTQVGDPDFVIAAGKG